MAKAPVKKTTKAPRAPRIPVIKKVPVKKAPAAKAPYSYGLDVGLKAAGVPDYTRAMLAADSGMRLSFPNPPIPGVPPSPVPPMIEPQPIGTNLTSTMNAAERRLGIPAVSPTTKVPQEYQSANAMEKRMNIPAVSPAFGQTSTPISTTTASTTANTTLPTYQQSDPVNVPNIDLMDLFDRLNPAISGAYAALQRQLGGAQQQQRGDFNNILARLQDSFNNSGQTFSGAVGDNNQYVQNFADKMGVGNFVKGEASTGLRNQQDARLGELAANLRQGMGMNLGTLANARNSMYDTFQAQAGAGALGGIQQLAQALLSEQSKGNLQSSRLAAQAAQQGSANELAFLKLQRDMQSGDLDNALKQARLQKLLSSAAEGDTSAVEKQVTENPDLLASLTGMTDINAKTAAEQALGLSAYDPEAAIKRLYETSMASDVDPLTGKPIKPSNVPYNAVEMLDNNGQVIGWQDSLKTYPIPDYANQDAIRARAIEALRPFAPGAGGVKTTVTGTKKGTTSA